MEIKLEVKSNLNLDAVSRSLQNPSQFLKDVQKFRRTSFYEAIASGRDATGARVTPLTQPYAKRKQKRYGKRAIRVASGAMQAAYDSDVSGNQLRETVDSPIAIYHQDGTSKMAKRQLLPENWDDLPSKERKMIERLATEFIDDLIDEIGVSSRGQYGF